MQALNQKVDLVLAYFPRVQTHPFYRLLLPVTYGIILLAAFFLSYTAVFDKKIDLNGDDTGYYLLGKAIASGKGYTNVHEIGFSAHNHFPPGYPVIIAGICKFFSDDLIFVKKVNGFFLLVSIVLLSFITWQIKRNIHLTFLVAFFTVLNGHLLEYSVNTMSEIPFMFFSLLCILLAMNTNFEKPVHKNILFGLLIICIAFTYYIRTTGISLVVGLMAFLILNKKWSYAVAGLAAFVALVIPWHLRGMGLGGNSYLHQLMMKNAYRPELGAMEMNDWLQRIWENLIRYFAREVPSCIEGTKINYDASASIGDIVKGYLIVQLILFGVWLLKHKVQNLLQYFILSYLAILLLWPDVWKGVRFLLPLLPLLLLLLINGVFETLQWALTKMKIKNYQTIALVTILAVAVILIKPYTHPLAGLKQAAKDEFPAAYKNYFEIAAWAKANTPDSAVICCRKREMFYLKSGRVTAPYLSTLNTEEQRAWLQNGNIDYVVMESLGFADTERYLEPVIKKYKDKFKVIKHLKNPDTYLMQVLR